MLILKWLGQYMLNDNVICSSHFLATCNWYLMFVLETRPYLCNCLPNWTEIHIYDKTRWSVNPLDSWYSWWYWYFYLGFQSYEEFGWFEKKECSKIIIHLQKKLAIALFFKLEYFLCIILIKFSLYFYWVWFGLV